MLHKESSVTAVPVERVVKVVSWRCLGMDLGVLGSTSSSGHLAGRVFPPKMFVGSPNGVGFRQHGWTSRALC